MEYKGKILDVSVLNAVWVSFLDDDEHKVQGFFKLFEQTTNYVKLISGKNVLTIPYHRLYKLKEVISDD